MQSILLIHQYEMVGYDKIPGQLIWHLEENKNPIRRKEKNIYIPLLFFACHPPHLLACLERETMRLKRKQIQTLNLWIIFITGFTCNSKICHTVSHFKSVSHWLKIFLYRKGIIRPLSSSKTFHCTSVTNSLFANKKQEWNITLLV